MVCENKELFKIMLNDRSLTLQCNTDGLTVQRESASNGIVQNVVFFLRSVNLRTLAVDCCTVYSQEVKSIRQFLRGLLVYVLSYKLS